MNAVAGERGADDVSDATTLIRLGWIPRVAAAIVAKPEATPLMSTTPVITALLAVAMGLDAPNPVKLIGAMISFVGVALVIAAGQGLNLQRRCRWVIDFELPWSHARSGRAPCQSRRPA